MRGARGGGPRGDPEPEATHGGHTFEHCEDLFLRGPWASARERMAPGVRPGLLSRRSGSVGQHARQEREQEQKPPRPNAPHRRPSVYLVSYLGARGGSRFPTRPRFPQHQTAAPIGRMRLEHGWTVVGSPGTRPPHGRSSSPRKHRPRSLPHPTCGSWRTTIEAAKPQRSRSRWTIETWRDRREPQWREIVSLKGVKELGLRPLLRDAQCKQRDWRVTRCRTTTT